MKIEKICNAYLKAHFERQYKHKLKTTLSCCSENGYIYFIDGHRLARVKDNGLIPFKAEDGTYFERLIDKYADKEVYFSAKLEIIGDKTCYVLIDNFDNEITYIDKKLYDEWFTVLDVELKISNLDNKSPIYIYENDECVGLILPIKKI